MKREGQGLNSTELSELVHLSATAIRKNMNDKIVEKYLTKEMLTDLKRDEIITEDNLFPFIKYKILSLGKGGIGKIYDVSEGLENRIFEAALKVENYSDLVKTISTKRYSNKKIQRILLHILTHTTEEDFKNYFSTKNYRVLAVKRASSPLIREINKEGKITLNSLLNSKNSMHFKQDIKVARIYEMLKKSGDIFRENVKIID